MARTKRDGNNHYHSHRDLPRSSSTSAGADPRKAKIGKCSRSQDGKKKLTENREETKITKLSNDQLYDLIAKRLNIVDFYSFGAVCKSWFEMFKQHKEEFLASQAPLGVLISSHAKRACYLYDMSNAKTHKVLLPTLVAKFYIGCSAGYLILENYSSQISLFNPFTKRQINVPSPPPFPRNDERRFLHDRIILASTRPPNAYSIVLALSTGMRFLQVYHSRYDSWFTFSSFGRTGSAWVDIAVMKNKVYGVTYCGHIGVLKLMGRGQTYGMFKKVRVKNPPSVTSSDLKLVVWENQLWMVDFVPGRRLNMYRLGFKEFEHEECTWVKVESLADKALFYGEKKGCAMRKAGRWGGRSNCVYRIETLSNICSVYSMQAQLIQSFSLVQDPSTMLSYSWYFPHQCMQIDYLLDD